MKPESDHFIVCIAFIYSLVMEPGAWPLIGFEWMHGGCALSLRSDFKQRPWMGGLNEQENSQMLLSNILKTSAVAALVGLGVAAAVSPATAATYETRCYGDDCYRVRCDDFGYACRRMEYMGDVGYVRHRNRLMCDAYGDDCHWVRTRIYDYDYDDDFYGD